jgi:hypothetical protein
MSAYPRSALKSSSSYQHNNQETKDDEQRYITPPPKPLKPRSSITSLSLDSDSLASKPSSVSPPPLPPKRGSSTKVNSVVTTEASPSSATSASSATADLATILPPRKPAKSSSITSISSERSSRTPSPTPNPSSDRPHPLYQRSSHGSLLRRPSNSSIHSAVEANSLIEVYKTGPMYKTNRDGKETLYNFQLDAECLCYKDQVSKVISVVLAEESIPSRIIPLHTVMACDLDVSVERIDYPIELCFKLLSKRKSFYLRCESLEERNDWYEKINYFAREVLRH